MKSTEVNELLQAYDKKVQQLALETRALLLSSVKGLQEQVDKPARMLAYGFGSGYTGMLFTIILSKKEIKLGFYKGSELPDPKKLLTGAGKVHKHIPVAELNMLTSAALKTLIQQAHVAYLQRTEQKKSAKK